MRLRVPLAMAAGLAAVVTSASGCSSAPTAAPHHALRLVSSKDSESTVAPAAVVLRAGRRTSFLRVAGQSVYVFSRDAANRSACYRECAAAWRPLVVQGGKPIGLGTIAAEDVGSIQRTDGVFQATYAGHPLYVAGTRWISHHQLTSFGGRWTQVRVGRPQRED
jgi:predicted lipoprotein with Yx(FWY)xxD motif